MRTDVESKPIAQMQPLPPISSPVPYKNWRSHSHDGPDKGESAEDGLRGKDPLLSCNQATLCKEEKSGFLIFKRLLTIVANCHRMDALHFMAF